MQRHDSQERMEAGSPRAAAPPASLESSPLGYETRSTKRRRFAPTESPSTSQASVVTNFRQRGPQTLFKAAQTRHTRPGCKRCNPLVPHMSTPPSSTRRSLPRKKVSGQRAKFNATWKALCLPCCAGSQPTASRPTKVSLFRLFGQMTLTPSVTFRVC